MRTYARRSDKVHREERMGPIMRKLTILAAMLALVAVVAVPAALAQGRGFDNDSFEDRFGGFFDDNSFDRFNDDDNGFFDRLDNNSFYNNGAGVGPGVKPGTHPNS